MGGTNHEPPVEDTKSELPWGAALKLSRERRIIVDAAMGIQATRATGNMRQGQFPSRQSAVDLTSLIA